MKPPTYRMLVPTPPSFLTASTASFRICDFLLNLKFIFCLMSCAVILLCIDVLSVPMYRPQCSPPGPGGIFKTCCAYHRRRFVDTHTRANYIPEHFLTVCFMQESLPCLSSSKPHWISHHGWQRYSRSSSLPDMVRTVMVLLRLVSLCPPNPLPRHAAIQYYCMLFIRVKCCSAQLLHGNTKQFISYFYERDTWVWSGFWNTAVAMYLTPHIFGAWNLRKKVRLLNNCVYPFLWK